MLYSGNTQGCTGLKLINKLYNKLINFLQTKCFKESCQSGRMGHPAKVLGEQSPRGFESLTLRTNNEPDGKPSGDYICAGE